MTSISYYIQCFGTSRETTDPSAFPKKAISAILMNKPVSIMPGICFKCCSIVRGSLICPKSASITKFPLSEKKLDQIRYKNFANSPIDVYAVYNDIIELIVAMLDMQNEFYEQI
jgi:hypothetical protein